MRFIVLMVGLFASSALAEAGSPYSFCAFASCECQATTCSCGQACNGNLGTCEPAAVAYCGSDAMCAGPCGSFICEGNVCVAGVRTDGGDGSTPPPPSNGCSTAPAMTLLFASLLFRRRQSAVAA
ncbi:MAG: hypothetical protein ACO1OB_09110 [Archangium sp.]